MNTNFRRIILYARHYRFNETIHATLHKLINFLSAQSIEVMLDKETASHFTADVPSITHAEMDPTSDLILVVGGDGSLLAAARFAIEYNIPVIGINRGRLGFLTDILPQEMESKLQAVIQGSYREEKRFLIQSHHQQNHEINCIGNALNDVVLNRGQETHLIEFEVKINQQIVSDYRADGLIIATPTGSTAYALSTGGPIMHPELNAIVIIPMFSHTLSSRPLVVSGDSDIEVNISNHNEHNLTISCDGLNAASLAPGDCLRLKRHPQLLRLLHPLDYHYYDTLRIKLGWQSHHHNNQNIE